MTSFARIHRDISALEVARFWKNGFVRLPGMLDLAQVRQLQQAALHATQTWSSSPNALDVTAAADAAWQDSTPVDNQGSTQHDLAALAEAVRAANFPRLMDQAVAGLPRGRFLVDTGVWRRAPALAQIALRSQLPQIAATLLGVPKLRYFDDQLLVKEPGALDRTAFHQDLSYFHLGGDHGCVFWIPLQDVRRHGGAMAYIPGSHRWGQIYKPNIFASAQPFPGSEGVDMPSIDANPEQYGVQYLEADAGDIIVHHFLTVHGSAGNRSEAPRTAFSLRYCDAEIRYRHRPGAPAQPLHRQHMGDGDALDDGVHPIVYDVPDEGTTPIAV